MNDDIDSCHRRINHVFEKYNMPIMVRGEFVDSYMLKLARNIEALDARIKELEEDKKRPGVAPSPK